MLLCCRVKDGPRLAPYAAYHTLLLGTYVQERSLSNLPGIRPGGVILQSTAIILVKDSLSETLTRSLVPVRSLYSRQKGNRRS